ncbi:E3 ubiquitin-protein ligase RNF217 isoform X2 [Apus apus]|uniref:E3 ubiquitin-protein ligase RNF217 isoform X2 n=1 Tax=Apus apus TaxID=8895 RepID=UPI0021F8E9DF|nr:E3 ubiquitin-protein ligase RNF217 isoform X2 [Apus apus]
MGEQQSSLSAPPAAAAVPPNPAGGPPEPGPDEPPPPRESAPGGGAAGPGRSGEPPPLAASLERRGAEEEEEATAAGSEQSPAAEEPAALAEEGPGPEGANGRRRAPRRHVYCTVYCVENDRPAAAPATPRGGPSGGGPGVGQPGARRGVAAGGDPLSARGSIEVVDLYLLPEPFSGLIAGEFGPLLVLSCRVCLEEKPIKPLSCCKKAVCEECLKRYLSSQVQLGQVDIKCPITECSEHLDETTVLYNLPHDDIIKYKYFLELSRIDSSTKPCPQCKHFTTFRRRGHIPTPAKLENKYKIQCPSCQFVWCFKCHSPWHEGVNCKEYKKGDKLLRHWANEIEHGQRNAQKCPKCKIHIQRTEGCDHMTCSQCNTNFCYRCGERYRQLRFFGDHTSNLSIFGCKYRYLPERPHLRRLVRGSVCAGKLLITPLILVLGLALGAIAVVIGLLETQSLHEADEDVVTDVDFTNMISEEEKEELKIELAKLEDEISTLRQVLAAKEKHLIEIKQKLGISLMNELKQNFSKSWHDMQTTSAYKKTHETLSQAGQKATAAISNVGTAISKKFGDMSYSIRHSISMPAMRNSPTFKSFEEKVETTVTSLKTKVGGTSHAGGSFEEVLSSTAHASAQSSLAGTRLPESEEELQC